jgi:hypothetical protein
MVNIDTIEMDTVSRGTEPLRPGTMTTSLLKSPLTGDFDGRDLANFRSFKPRFLTARSSVLLIFRPKYILQHTIYLATLEDFPQPMAC